MKNKINWRWNLFWLKDIISGGKVKQAYDDLNRNYKNVDTKEQQKKVNYLLKYAQKNTNYYKKYKNVKLQDFPIINKQIIKENLDDILVQKYNIESLHKMSTSGSTGTPFTVYQNKEKRNRVIAEVLFYGKKANYIFGEKQAYFRIWVSSIKKSTIKKKLQNMYPIDISNLSDENINNIIRKIDKKRIVNVLSYASTLDKISDYCKKNNVTIKGDYLKSIISSSEFLNKNTKENLKNIFNCNVYNRYSNEENGILAQDMDLDENLYLNQADYFFEFLKLETNEPAKEGELARVVVTDLYNFAMPMIRYDTGDTAIYTTNSKGKITAIKSLQGRQVDMIYNTKGEAISPHTITNNMWGNEIIKQFKFIQISSNTYKIILNIDKKDGKAIEEQLKKKFYKILGKDAKIDIDYVDEIPILKSGKLKYIENQMKKR